MNQDEADKESTQPPRIWRAAGWAATLLALLLVVIVPLVTTAHGGRAGAQTDGSPVTVIATASVVPTVAAAVPPIASGPPTPGYRLVFRDEFSQKRLDSSRWERSLRWGRTNRAEQQYYAPSAVTQNGGDLKIIATQQAQHGKAYTSGAVNSLKSFAFKYGYAEVRAQLPSGDGLWPAFWLASGVPGSLDEIDVIEAIGSEPTKGLVAVHSGAGADRHEDVKTYVGPDLTAQMHTFAVDWEPGRITWYLDGRRVFTTNQHVPARPMYLVANLALGGAGSWAGAVTRSTQFPAVYAVDYVRVWQK